MKGADQKSMVRVGSKPAARHGRTTGRLRVEVSWNFGESRPEFWPTLTVPTVVDGSEEVKLDVESIRPDPGQYWLFGIAASFAGTFVELASTRELTLHSLKVVVEGRLRPVVLEEIIERPLMDSVKLKLVVDTDADRETVERLQKMTRNLCPGAYYLANAVTFDAKLERAN